MGITSDRVIKNTGYLYAKMGITMLISLYTTRIILHSLGTSDFGIFSVVGGAIAMLGFISAPMAGATQRFMSYNEGVGDRERQKSIFNISMILHFLLSLIVGLVLLAVGLLFFDGLLNIPAGRSGAARMVYGSLIVSTMFTVMTVPYDAVLNAHENMKYYAVVGIIESLLKLGVAMVVTFTSDDRLAVYGILTACIPLVTLTIMRIYCHGRYPECTISLRRYWDRSLMRDMTSFAGWDFMNSMSSMLTMRGTAILLNVFGGVKVNTAHGIAGQLSGQVMAFSNNMLKALNPTIVKASGAGRNDTMLRAASTGSKLSFAIFAVFAMPFLLEMPYILSLWLGDVPPYAVLFCRLVFIRQMLDQLRVTYITCINATGRIRRMKIVSSIIWFCPLPMCYVLYRYGAPIHTIYVLLIIMIAVHCINTLSFCTRLCGLRMEQYVARTLMPTVFPAAAALVLMAVPVQFMESSIYRLGVVALLSATVYPLFVFHIGLDRHERGQIVTAAGTLTDRLLRREKP